MCPLNRKMQELLLTYQNRLDISLCDITGQPALAKVLGMYYPTLTIVQAPGKTQRYFSPLSAERLELFCLGQFPQERPYLPRLGTKEKVGTLVPLTAGNLALASGCTGCAACPGWEEKRAALEAMGLSTFGFLNVENGKLLGGAEFVPSLQTPYPIPRKEDTAFLTCVYLSSEENDSKSAPLRALEQWLAVRSYRRILAVSDEHGVFPNGDLAFFLRNGYADRGVVAQEEGYCRLHLVEKNFDA